MSVGFVEVFETPTTAIAALLEAMLTTPHAYVLSFAAAVAAAASFKALTSQRAD